LCRIKFRAIQIQKTNASDHIFTSLTCQTESHLGCDVVDIILPPIKSDDFHACWAGEPGIKPPFHERSEGGFFCVALHKKKEFHASASSSPDRSISPSLYFFNHSLSCSPSMVLKRVSPFVHCATVVVG